MAEPGVIGHLCDLDTDVIADVSGLLLEKQVTVRWNLPRQVVVTMPAASSLLLGNHDDGFRKLCSGDRKLILWEEDRDDEAFFHGRIDKVERIGDGQTNLVRVTAVDALVELGSEASGRAGRYVRDADGTFVLPEFGDTITGAELLYQSLVNSQQTGVESDPTPGEGPLPILVDEANFSSTVNLSMDNFMSWPLFIGDLIAILTGTGVLDVKFRPIDPSEGEDDYLMVEAIVGDLLGTDRSGTVHFDYWTGSKNAETASHIDDFATVMNKLYDYLGPPISGNARRWRDNITPGTSGTTIDPSDSRTRYRTQLMQIRFFDQFRPTHTDPMALAQWNAEAGYRVFPRELLVTKPLPGSAALFRPLGRDFDAGDLVTQNVGAALGLSLSEPQRVLGYTCSWDADNVMTVSELLTSADVDLG